MSCISVIEDGLDICAFDTASADSDLYPRVYVAWAMRLGSPDARRPHLRWIKWAQYQWLVKHCECHVIYLGPTAPQNDISPVTSIFYCRNHRCWEKDGLDYVDYAYQADFKHGHSKLDISKEKQENNFRVGDYWDEEREV